MSSVTYASKNRGFHVSDDPMADENSGYRSHKLKTPHHGFDFPSSVSYNGFTFPPTCRTKATIVPEYNKAGTSIKWLMVSLDIEFLVTQWDQEGFDADHDPTVDTYMDAIRLRLMQPCQQLTFYLQGLGHIVINGNGTVADGGGTASQFATDVNYGPKPQVMEWEPRGPLACNVQWLCITYLDPFYFDTQKSIMSDAVEFTYELNWGVDHGGFITRTVNAELELFTNRITTKATTSLASATSNNVINLTENKKVFDDAVNKIKALFPRMVGFHREESYSVGKSKKHLKFVVQDREIPTDQAFPKGILDLEMNENLSSTFEDKGFLIWTWTFNISASVPNGNRVNSSILGNKNLAYDFITQVIRTKVVNISKRVKAYAHSKDLEGDSDLNTVDRNVRIFPLEFSIDNSTYSNRISVQASYTLYCVEELIYAASGIFDTVRSAYGDEYDGVVPTWAAWIQYLEKNGVKLPPSAAVPRDEIVIDLGHPLRSTATLGPQPFKGHLGISGRGAGGRYDIFNPEVPNEGATWIDYRNKFYFLNENFTSVTVATSPQAEESSDAREERLANAQNSGKDAFNDGNIENNPTESVVVTQTTAEPIRYITMVGTAFRLGYPIAAPNIVSVGKASVQITGDDVQVQERLPTGMTAYQNTKKKDQKGQDIYKPVTVDIYKLSWRRTYIIIGDPGPRPTAGNQGKSFEIQFTDGISGHPHDYM